MATQTKSELTAFLRSYDTSGSGKFDRDRWLHLCASASINLPQESAADLFDRLDTDRDGIVTISELLNDLMEWQKAMANNGNDSAEVGAVDVDRFAVAAPRMAGKRMESLYESTPEELDSDFGKSVEEAARLSRVISDSYPELASSFQQLLVTFKNDISLKKAEKENLEDSYRREKQARKQDLDRLEKELDSEIQLVEERLREELGKKYEAVYLEKVWKKELETRHYQETVQDLKQQVHENRRKLSTVTTKRTISPKNGSEEDSVFANGETENGIAFDTKLKNEAIQLRKKLADAQTYLTASEAELEQLRTTVKDQSSALHIEKLRSSKFIEEKDLLYDQIHRLRETLQEVHGKHAALHEYGTGSDLLTIPWRRDSGQWSGSNENSERHPPIIDADIFTRPESVISGWSNLDQPNNPDRIFRIIMVGDAAVGKTCFMHRFCIGEFFHNTKATIGVDFKTKNMMIDGSIYTFEIWDTAGCERYRSLAANFFRKCDGAILMYDVSSKDSFLGVRDWVHMLEENTGDAVVPRILVANKIDLRDAPHNTVKPDRSFFVSKSEGENLAKTYNADFMETSVLNYINVDEVIVNLSRSMKYREDCQGSGIKISKKKPLMQIKQCCT